MNIESPYNFSPVSIKTDLLLGDLFEWCYPDFLETDYFANLMFYLKNLKHSDSSTVLPNKIENVFKVFRDVTELTYSGKNIKAVIIGNEIIDSRASNGRAFTLDIGIGTKLPTIHPEFIKFAKWMAYEQNVNINDPFFSSLVDLTGDDLFQEGVILLPGSPIASTITSGVYNEMTEPLTAVLINMISELSVDITWVFTDKRQEYLKKYIDTSDNYIMEFYGNDVDLFDKIEQFRHSNGLITNTIDKILL